MKEVEAVVYLGSVVKHPSLGWQVEQIKAEPYKAFWGRAGNSTFAISGPSKRNKYTIAREVR